MMGQFEKPHTKPDCPRLAAWADELPEVEWPACTCRPAVDDVQTALPLNEYQAANLRWLLCHAYHGTAPLNLNTGDWCGELLWELEQRMIDLEIKYEPNERSPPWPLTGWHNGPTPVA